MKKISKLLISFPIHFIMGIISSFFFLSSFNALTHSGVEVLSVTLLLVNICGYLILSMLFLKSRKPKEVMVSTSFFLGIGLFIWVIFLTTGQFDNLFFIYHLSGYSSSMWYVYLFTNTNERLLVELGVLYSVVPSILILVGFYLSKHIKTKESLRRISLYMGNAIFSVILVFLSGFNGKRIETREELSNAFPMKTGFPLNFAELSNPNIDPPLPWTYGGFDCCSLSVFSWTNFWLSATIIFLFMLVLLEVVLLVYRKSNNKPPGFNGNN